MNLNQSYRDISGNLKPQRLHVFLAHSGIASRRACEELISQGRISVNGKIITIPGQKVAPEDIIHFDGKQVSGEKARHYYVLHKPPLYISSSYDPQKRDLALSLLPDLKERLYNIGRLDYRSSGLLLFTNDGDFAYRVSHPKANIEKEYYVESTIPIPDRLIYEFSNGLLIDGILYKAQNIERLGNRELKIILVEGKNREIRRVFSHYRLHPSILRRIRIGHLLMGSLKEGESRPLTNEELNKFNIEI